MKKIITIIKGTMKKNTEKAVIAYRILQNAKLGKMKDDDKFAVVKIMKELKPIAIGYDDFIKDAAEKLKPEGVEKIQAKLQGNENLDVEEQKIWAKYNQDVTKCVTGELNKEIEFTFAPLSEAGFKGLLESNDFTMSEILALDEVIGE